MTLESLWGRCFLQNAWALAGPPSPASASSPELRLFVERQPGSRTGRDLPPRAPWSLRKPSQEHSPGEFVLRGIGWVGAGLITGQRGSLLPPPARWGGSGTLGAPDLCLPSSWGSLGALWEPAQRWGVALQDSASFSSLSSHWEPHPPPQALRGAGGEGPWHPLELPHGPPERS